MTRIDSPHRSTEASEAEWLEADGRGGFASGTAGGERTRRYHALLLAATHPPAGRVVLVNGIEAWIESARGGRYPLTRHRYMPDHLHPPITADLMSFNTEPWPTWRFCIGDGWQVTAEVFVAHGAAQTVLRWRLESVCASDVQHETQAGHEALTLKVRPLLSGRDYHALHHENPAFDFTAHIVTDCVCWQPYPDQPVVVAQSNGTYTHEPDWYRNFCYTQERERGLDYNEDLATPGLFSFDLAQGDAVLILSAQTAANAEAAAPEEAAPEEAAPEEVVSAAALALRLDALERVRRASFAGRLQRSADEYVVARGAGRTIIAGYPWFTDWGRDTFIAMRGLLLASGRYAEAESILLGWTETISEGMLPNRFPDDGGAPVYNAVDASLWFVVAVHDYLQTAHASSATRERLQQAVNTIVQGYADGTRFNIAADDDGLLRAGVPGVQLTWMDAKVGDWVVAPRIGKPVEVQALWINALRIALAWDTHWSELETLASTSFAERFVNSATGALYDVIDVDHEPGRVDASVRPNQIFATGGLPHAVIDGQRARAVVRQVEAQLLTPLGLRSLAPCDPAYVGRYEGTVLQRDGAAYHQGTVWPWLLGPFVQAWLRVQRAAGVPDSASVAAARARFLTPLYAHLDAAGLDHVSEIADGDAPHTPRGAPFQAWSLGELLRIEKLLGT